MSTFEHRIEVSASEAGPFVPLRAVVDTGAAYTLLPQDVVERLHVVTRGRRQFILADGRTVDRAIAVVSVKLDGQILPTICVVGEPGTIPLLGAVTLEEFGLAADPVNRRLVPMPHLYLLAIQGRGSFANQAML